MAGGRFNDVAQLAAGQAAAYPHHRSARSPEFNAYGDCAPFRFFLPAAA